jgi:hypothetical protein
MTKDKDAKKAEDAAKQAKDDASSSSITSSLPSLNSLKAYWPYATSVDDFVLEAAKSKFGYWLFGLVGTIIGSLAAIFYIGSLLPGPVKFVLWVSVILSAYLSFHLVSFALDKPILDRGGGLVPKLECASGYVKLGALCYKKCPAPYSNLTAGLGCDLKCPNGSHVPLGRGCDKHETKYNLKHYKDPNGKKNCEKANGKGKCHWSLKGWGAGCKKGYKLNSTGVCIKEDSCGSGYQEREGKCHAHKGLHGGNKQYTVPHRTTCPSSHPDFSVGFCYKKCQLGYRGNMTNCNKIINWWA